MSSTIPGSGVQPTASQPGPSPSPQLALPQSVPRSTTFQSTPAQSTPAQRTPAQQTPAQQTPAQPTPSQPTSRLSNSSPSTLSDGTSANTIISVPQNNTGNSNIAQNPHGAKSNTHSFRSLLRSVGLKVLTSIRGKPDRKEEPKVIVSQSLRIALTRAGIHIFPITITCFLLLFNGLVLLNGPDITTGAVFVLQVASKLHELAIVGSLTSIVLDLLHYHLLDDGLSIGLLGSGLSVGSPSWLWSMDFISGFKTSMSSRPRLSMKDLNMRSLPSKLIQSKLFLFGLLVSCTLLATTVGPASALLFIPIQLWVPSASTDFYVAGTEDMLWPATLGRNHTGPELCSISPLPVDVSPCLNGAWRALAASFTHGFIEVVRPNFAFFTAGTSAWELPPARVIRGNIPVPESNYAKGDPDTWAVAPHMAVASLTDYLNNQVKLAFGYAKGRNRRLRDFVEGEIDVTTGGKFPIVRTVCGSPTAITGPSSEINIPLVPEDTFWRPQIQHGIGPMRSLTVESLNLEDWDALQSKITTDQQCRAQWVPLPEGLGSGSAALVFLGQNRTATWAYTCVIDARWATGQTMQTDRSILWSWESQAGQQAFDHRTSPGDYHFQRASLFDSRYTPSYSRPIKIEQEWLNALTPAMPEASLPGNGLVMNTFEALLNQSILSDNVFLESAAEIATIKLEYVTTIFFTNALSSIGLSYQVVLPSDLNIKQDLWPNDITDDSFISGKMIFNLRDPSEPYVRAHYQQFKYGTAWSLAKTGQYLGVTILGIHVVLALAHTLTLTLTKRSSAAWDSINELVILAYNSAARPGAFENCNSGIEVSRTLEREIRIGTRLRRDGNIQAELVICGDEDGAGHVVPGEQYG